MQRRCSFFAVLLSGIVFGGCAGLMNLELRDGRTMEKGKGEGAVRLTAVSSAAAILADSVFNGGLESVAPALGIAGYYGLTDRLELNAGAWTSALFTAPVTSFRTVDIGLRGGLRFMATPREWRHNVALGVSGWWHGGMNLIVRFDDDLRYYGTAYGIDPSLLWSYRLVGREDRPGVHSIYVGGKLSFARADYTYGYSGGDSSASVTLREYHGGFRGIAPCIGVRTFGNGFFEIGATVLQHPESNRTYWIPALGFGWNPQN